MTEPTTLAALDRAHLIHPHRGYRAQETQDPRLVTGGKGIRIEMSDGRVVIDAFSGLWNVNVGHGRSEIGEAVLAQMKQVAYYPSFYDFSSAPPIRLAEKLVALFPPDAGIERFLFTSGGSEANETAFHFARQYHAVKGNREKRKIVSRTSAYHGVTRAAGSATRLEPFHILEDPDPLHIQTAAPYCFRCELDKTYPECQVACAEDLASVLAREGADTVAAVIAEPVMGTGGVILPPPEYFGRLQEICRESDVLLILDEVITGFGRTGRWFGMEHWGVKPDIVTFAKGITSGYVPLGGVGLTGQIYSTLRDESPKGLPFMSGLTYNNHPTACAAALANIEILENERMIENVAETSPYLEQRLRESVADVDIVGDIRVFGYMAAIEWAAPGTKDPLGGRRMVFPPIVSKKAWDRGLIVRPLWESTVLAPPLCTTREDVDEIADLLSASAKEAVAALR